MRKDKFMLLPVAGALVAALALSACDRREDQTAGQKVDETVAQVDRKTDELNAKAKADAQQAKQAGQDAVAEFKQDAREAKNDTKQALTDSAITARVNAQLAADPKLSALQINVDTSEGRVLLRGTAPDFSSRERATQMASAIDGVKSVDNQIVVSKS